MSKNNFWQRNRGEFSDMKKKLIQKFLSGSTPGECAEFFGVHYYTALKIISEHFKNNSPK